MSILATNSHNIIIVTFFSICKQALLNDNCTKGRCDMFDYSPLWETMKKRGITTYVLINKYEMSSRTISNLKHNKSITMETLAKLCSILGCQPNDIVKIM